MTETTLLYITATTSFITALAAIFSPIIAAAVTQRGERKVKTMELFFSEKSKAYLHLIETLSAFPMDSNTEDRTKLFEAKNAAYLFSGKDTRKKIDYLSSLLTSGSPDNQLLAEAFSEAFSAMQQELQKSNNPA